MALMDENARLIEILAKVGRRWSSGPDEAFGGMFLCVHGLTPSEVEQLLAAGTLAHSRPEGK